MNTTVNLNGGKELIKENDKEIFMIVNCVVVTAVICLFGLVANVMNLIVFTKQGFHSTMNITLFSLAVSDMGSLLGLLWGGVCLNPLLVKSDINFVTHEVLHLTGGIPHICFVRITGWITVFVTAERCLCITLPLKIKQIITPKVTKSTVLFIYISIMLSFVPEYEMVYFGWKFHAPKNRTMFGLVFRSNRGDKEGIIFVLYSALGTISFVAIIVLTLVLVIQLKKKTEWRARASKDERRTEAISNRDKKSMKMVVLIATVLIVCYAPGAAVSVVTFFDEDFNLYGLQTNLFFVVWTFVFIFEALNSSVNIFLYYRMSTKYRDTFNQCFACLQTGQGVNTKG